MVKHYRFFDELTGLFHPMFVKATSFEDALASQPPGHKMMEGDIDHFSQRVDLATGAVVDYVPPQPSANHQWNETVKRWVLNDAVAAENVKRSTAVARITQLEAAQHRPLRELAQDPSNAEARKRIDTIDDEIKHLREMLRPATGQ